MTTSRMGIMGSFLLSNFSLGFYNSFSRLWSFAFCRWSLVARHSGSRTTKDHRPATDLARRFFDHGQRDVSLLNHLASHFKFLNLLLTGETIHQLQHEFFENHAQTAGADLASHGLACNRPVGFVAEFEPDILELKQPLVLLHDRVLRTRQNFD